LASRLAVKERLADRDWVLRMAAEAVATLRNAANLAKCLGEGIEFVEEIPGRFEEVHLVRRDKSAKRQGIIPDETHRFAVARNLVVRDEIHPLDDSLEAKCFRSTRKYFHDGRLSGRHPNEIDRSVARGRV
jgi:hypothetical protein